MKIKRTLFFLCPLLLVVIACGGNKKCWLDNYPIEVPHKTLNDLTYWDIHSITCVGHNETGYSDCYKFLIKGTGKKAMHSGITSSRYVDFYSESAGTKDITAAGTFIFPNVKEGESFELEIFTLHTEYSDPRTFTGFAISYGH